MQLVKLKAQSIENESIYCVYVMINYLKIVLHALR